MIEEKFEIEVRFLPFAEGSSEREREREPENNARYGMGSANERKSMKTISGFKLPLLLWGTGVKIGFFGLFLPVLF